MLRANVSRVMAGRFSVHDLAVKKYTVSTQIFFTFLQHLTSIYTLFSNASQVMALKSPNVQPRLSSLAQVM